MQLIKNQITPSQYYAYLFGNCVLNFLNWLWYVVFRYLVGLIPSDIVVVALTPVSPNWLHEYNLASPNRFYKMIRALQKRFKPTGESAAAANGKKPVNGQTRAELSAATSTQRRHAD